MEPKAIQAVLARLLRSLPGPLIETSADTAQLPARAVGDVLQAKLVGDLPNGRSLIEVKGIRLDVKLPVALHVGETLDLEVVALEPRLTLAVVGTPPGARSAQVALSESVRNLAAALDRLPPAAAGSAGTSAAPALPGTSATPALPGTSATPMLTAMSAAAGPAVTSAAPVLDSPPADTRAFAESLRSTLGRSGLFYESHQAQWVAGERPLGDLMREPQAALKSSAEAVHPQAVALVRQQLETLETGQLVWNGQVWPNQQLDWRIEQEAARQQTPGDAPPAWKTSLRLTLPRLGEVTATLSISGDSVRLAFFDLADDTKSAVRTGQVALREAFENAGLSLLEVRVDRDEA